MTDKVELLADISAARSGYKDFARPVDDDLRRERDARLAAERGRIRDIIIRAFVAGASIAELKRAYGTKDYSTIRLILDSAEAEIAALRQAEETGPTDWFEFNEGGDAVTILDGEGAYGFSIVYFPEDNDYMLNYIGDLDPNIPQIVSNLDGKFESEKISPEANTLFRAIRERGTTA